MTKQEIKVLGSLATKTYRNVTRKGTLLLQEQHGGQGTSVDLAHRNHKILQYERIQKIATALRNEISRLNLDSNFPDSLAIITGLTTEIEERLSEM